MRRARYNAPAFRHFEGEAIIYSEAPRVYYSEAPRVYYSEAPRVYYSEAPRVYYSHRTAMRVTIEWHFEMKIHSGCNVQTGYVHTITTIAANEYDITQNAFIRRKDRRECSRLTKT